MAKRRKKTSAEIHEEVERELENDPTVQLLKERIAYHRAKLAEERVRPRLFRFRRA